MSQRSPTTMTDSIFAILQLTRLNLPVGTLLLLWPTMTALLIAGNGSPGLELLLIFAIGTVLMRSAGCVINDIADREIDRQVQRTFKRPLAEDRITVGTAWLVFIVLTILAAGLVWRLNVPTRILACIGLCIAMIYPFVKRFSMWPQLVLGVAFSWGIPMAATAVSNQLTEVWPLIALYIATFCWIVAYDTIYAMVDESDDRLLNIGSTALRFGTKTPLFFTILNVLALLAWLVMGIQLGASMSFYIFLFVIALFFVFQIFQAYKPNNREGWFIAFKSNTWVGLLLFGGVYFSNYSTF